MSKRYLCFSSSKLKCSKTVLHPFLNGNYIFDVKKRKEKEKSFGVLLKVLTGLCPGDFIAPVCIKGTRLDFTFCRNLQG